MQITFDCLSQKSIKKAIRQIREYQKKLDEKCKLIAENLAEKGVEIAKVQIADLDAVFTGDLLDSIHSEYKGSSNGSSVYAVVADSDHAVFVEFGTGIVGKQSPYPYDFPEGISWEYASGKTIRQLADGRYGWFYPGNDGKWYFTEGMPARPFMHYTAEELREIALETVKEVFGGG